MLCHSTASRTLRLTFTASFVLCITLIAINSFHHQPQPATFGQIRPPDTILGRGERDINKVLILSLGRSGSSMLGTLVSTLRDRTFYYFEPFYGLYSHSHQQNLTLMEQMLQDSLTCNFNNTLTERFHRKYHQMPAFVDYTLTHFVENGTSAYSASKRQDDKFSLWSGVCRESQFRVLKVIRGDKLRAQQQVHLLEDLLKEFSDLFIVVLLRDPRAVLHSRVSIAKTDGAFENADIADVCNATSTRFQTISALEQSRNGARIALMKYEDIASRPEATMRQLAERMGIPVRNQTIQWIRENMSCDAGSKIGGYSTTKHCPDHSLTAWKNATKKLSIANSLHCKAVMLKMGYL